MAADLRITMPEDLLKALRDETNRLDIKVSTFVAGLIAQELGDKVESSEEETGTPIERRVCKIRLVGPDADYIQRRSKELNITPKQMIGKLISEKNSTTINIAFLEDYMDEFRTMENQIRKICYYASRDESHQVSEEMIQQTLQKLDDLIALFCQIYKELLKTKQNIIKNAKKAGE